MLELLLTLVYESDQALTAAGDYAGVDPATEGAMLRLWMDTLESNPSLIPDGVLRLTPEEGVEALVAGAGYFLVGYLLARREMIAAWEELGLDPFVP
jgi:hypothetical protein